MARPRGLFIGLATVDLIHRIAQPVGINEKATALSQEMVAGGPAANAAVTFALLGGDPVLVTDLGNHTLAELVRQDLQAYGVRVRAVEPDSPLIPAVSSIRVLDATGERSVVSVNASTRTVAAPTWLPDAVGGVDVLLLDGHHPLLAVAAARAARDRGVPVLLDAGSWKPVLDELLPLVDVAVCSADFKLPDGAPPSSLLERGVRRVAISHGPDPIHWWSAEPGDRRAGSVIAGGGVVPVPQVPVRDTMGAGDVLHGALAWHMGDRPDRAFDRQLFRAATQAAGRCQVAGISSWRAQTARRRLTG